MVSVEHFEGVMHVESVHVHYASVDDDLAHLQTQPHILNKACCLLSGD